MTLSHAMDSEKNNRAISRAFSVEIEYWVLKLCEYMNNRDLMILGRQRLPIIDILYILDSASNYSAIQKLKP